MNQKALLTCTLAAICLLLGCQATTEKASPVAPSTPPPASIAPTQTPLSSTMPITTAITPPADIISAEPTPELPRDGDSRAEFLSPYQFEYYGVPTYINNIVGADKVTAWLEQFESLNNPDGRDPQDMNIVNIVLELQVPKEDLIAANHGLVFSEEQIDAIYSGDRKRINEAFVHGYALLSNEKIYTADWLAEHTVADYRAEGLTEEVLCNYLAKIDIDELRGEYDQISRQLGQTPK